MNKLVNLVELVDTLGLNSLLPNSATEEKVLRETEKIGGHFLPTEIITLFRFAKFLPDNSKVLEIGSYRGRSSNAIGHAITGTNKRLFCLDLWKNFDSQPTGPRQTDNSANNLLPTDFAIFEDFLKNTDWFSDNLSVLKGSTKQFAGFLPTNFFDLIFIDAAHDYENVCYDIKTAIACLAPGGILAGHDYHSYGVDVVRAVNEEAFAHPNVFSHGTIGGTSIWAATFK